MSDHSIQNAFDPKTMVMMHKMFAEGHPGFQEYRFEIVDVSKGKASMRLPYNERFVGDRSTGSLHGGIITLLMDTVGGLCAMSAIQKMSPLATLDLRMDYLRPTTKGVNIIAEVECYHMTSSAAFVRGIAYEESPEREAVAHMAAAFMLNTKGPNLLKPERFSGVEEAK